MRSRFWFSRDSDARPIDRAVEAFEASIGSGRPSLERFWAGLGPERTPAILAALIKVDLWRRFESGERPRVLEYLEKFPFLADHGDRVISLVYEEFCLLQQLGENPDSRVFCRDYQPWSDSLASQLDYHRDLSRVVGLEALPVKFPEPGETFEKYRLISLLGVGGVARVYLAIEEGLGGRQLAIKVSASFGQEPSILANLDHRGIVPVLTVAKSESGLMGLCMPYRPGPTLEGVIRRIGRGTPPRAARAIAEALRPRDSPRGIPIEEEAGWANFPIDRTFPEAVAWIGQSLAHALGYCHERGVFHRDIKPANILLAYQEGPQLFDFNLAEEPNNPESASVAQKGGTLPYMAPEQLKAYLDRDAWDGVEQAADLYSLGLVLRELLTGQPPEMPTSRGSIHRVIGSLLDRRLAPQGSIREINPGVPPALDTIIGKCLAVRPEDRYRRATDLERDLRLFLERRPLRNAPNTSGFERGFNWIHRNRHPLAAAVLCATLFVLLFSLLQWNAAVRADADRKAAAVRADADREASVLADADRDSNLRNEFLLAESYLDSKLEADWLKSKAAFEKLHLQRPNFAMSSLGLALTLLKLPNPDRRTLSDLFKEAGEKPDAEAAFRHRLDKEPTSVTLLINLGIILSANDEDDLAREKLEEAHRINPKAYGVFVALANLEQKVGNDELTAAHLARAIELGRQNPAIVDLREVLLNILVKLVDRDLEAGDSSEARSRATSFFHRLESHLRSFEEDWERFKQPGDREDHLFALNFSQGCLCSIGGVLGEDSDYAGLSKFLFEEAEAYFGNAKAALADRDATGDRLQRVHKQEERLEKRRRSTVTLD